MHSGETELMEKSPSSGAQNRSFSDRENARLDSFSRRHIGPNSRQIDEMLDVIGYSNLDALIEATIPKNIRLNRELHLPKAKSENDAIAELRAIASKNKVARSFIGAGYSDCITPPVIQRNILENPGWYTAYTPYQAELAQGRLEALLNFQTIRSRCRSEEIFCRAQLSPANDCGRPNPRQTARDRSRSGRFR